MGGVNDIASILNGHIKTHDMIQFILYHLKFKNTA